MKNTILKYLNNLLEFEENSLVNIECDLLDSECVGSWKDEALNEKEKVKFRIHELQKCIKFLNEETVKRESECESKLWYVEFKQKGSAHVMSTTSDTSSRDAIKRDLLLRDYDVVNIRRIYFR